MKQIKPAIMILLIFSVITGLIYPILITGLAQLFFPSQANGSLIVRDGKVIGSTLIGQQFSQPEYFWGRISATSGEPYNASASGGSNYSALNPKLKEEAQTRIDALQAADPGNTQPVPVDLVTSSGSGLDPEISVAAAEYQAARVARTRGLTLEQVDGLIRLHTHGRFLGMLGEKTVNVLEINLALDALQ